jgi:hypothetical protein
MKISLFLILVSGGLGQIASAQLLVPPSQSEAPRQQVDFGVSIAVGNFSKSHGPGVGIGYSRSQNRFRTHAKPAKFIGWVLDGGLNYFVGKKVKEPTYEFRYGGYLNLYAGGGIIVNPFSKGNIILTTGPSLDIYKQSANAGLRVKISTHYFLFPEVAIGAGFTWLKHLRSESLLAPSINVAYAF